MYSGSIAGMFKRAVATLALAAAGATAAFGQPGDAVTLKWALWDLDKIVYFKPVVDAYQAKHPNVKFEAVDLGSQDYNQMVATQLAGGSKDIDIVSVKDVPNYPPRLDR